jgi:hypothetical protein
VIALLCLVAVPSSATAGLPFGGLLPIVVAIVVQVVGLIRARRSLSWPPGFIFAPVFLGLTALGTDPFYALIAPVSLMQYVLAWSAPDSGRRVIRNWLIAIAAAASLLGMVEGLTGAGPLLGEARTIDATNPFLTGLQRSQATLGHPLVLALLILVGLGLAVAARDLRMRYRFSAILILLAGSIFTGSTTTVLIAAAIVVLALIFRRGLAGALYATLWMVIACLFLAAANLWPSFLLSDLNERTAAHRLNAIASIPDLFDERRVIEVFFGSSSVEALYDRGVLINDGFFAVDNQAVTTLALGGLIGMLAAIAFTVTVFVRTKDRLMWVVYAVFALTALSFDFLLWYVGAALLFTVAGIAQTPAAVPRQLTTVQSADDAVPVAK